MFIYIISKYFLYIYQKSDSLLILVLPAKRKCITINKNTF